MNPDIAAEAQEVAYWSCACGGTLDLEYDGNEPIKRCQDCGEEEAIEMECL
jgi:hypothetical protein